MITKKIPELPGLGREATAGDFVHGWDSTTGKSVRIDIAQLPKGGSGGGGGGSTTIISIENPFTILNTSPNYDASTPGKVIIRDARLLNKTQYPVSTTQFGGGEFRKSMLTYFAVDPVDDSLGRVEINGFQLDDGEHITIAVPGDADATGDTSIAALKSQVQLHHLILGPFLKTALGPNGGKIWWPKNAGDIPQGWQECVAMRGVIPVGQDPTDAYDAGTNPDGLSRGPGTKGGSKTHTNTVAEMAPHDHDIIIPSRDLANYANSGPDLTSAGEGDTRTLKTEKAGGVDNGTGSKSAKPYSIMNPYIIGIWIEFVGL